jgi:hypothetical protein
MYIHLKSTVIIVFRYSIKQAKHVRDDGISLLFKQEHTLETDGRLYGKDGREKERSASDGLDKHPRDWMKLVSERRPAIQATNLQ